MNAKTLTLSLTLIAAATLVACGKKEEAPKTAAPAAVVARNSVQ